MSQNRSTAVMNRRHEADDSLDDFPTMPWGTRALCEHVIAPMIKPGATAWEPACNRGYMARPLREYFGGRVYASDVHDYGWPEMNGIDDFCFPGAKPDFGNGQAADWIISNPPFRLAEQFILLGLQRARVGCAMLVRTNFLEGVGRYQRLYKPRRPHFIAVFTERLPLVKGRVDRKARSATSYCWMVWTHQGQQGETVWIPPCRKRLERDADYL